MILHIDMDAFFAAVEQRDNPWLKNRPVVISGHSKRSVVATASYEARKFGIHSAMPLFQAEQRCKDLVIVPGDKAKYAVVSRQIMAIISQFTPRVEPVSIDEAYADVTGCEKLFGPPRSIAMAIKQEIQKQVGLTCSIGIAPVKFLAKIASDMNKPDGLTLIPKEQIDHFIANLPIEKIPGVGKQAMAGMKALRVQTLGDVRKLEVSLLENKFGKFGTRLCKLCQGIDPSQVATDRARKSISSETTLDRDIHEFAQAKNILLALSQRVGQELRGKELICKNVSIKIKFSDFTHVTRSQKTHTWICSSKEIFDHALSLYKKIRLKKKIRLLGVGVATLRDRHTPIQMDLLQTRDHEIKKQWESVDTAVDGISEKFGKGLVMKASLAKGHGKDKDKNKHIAGKGGNMSDQDQNPISLQVTITGRVQGVFFRAETRRTALGLHLKGYVKNCADGSVRALFQGNRTDVDQMLAWCRKGSPSSRVDRVDHEKRPLDPGMDGFDIRY